MEMFQSNIYYYVRIKEYIVSTQEMCLEKTYQDVPRQIFKILANKSRRAKTYVPRNKFWKLSQKTRFLCVHKILVHAQHSCACTTLLAHSKLRQQPGPGPAGSWAGPAWFKMLLGLWGNQWVGGGWSFLSLT